MRDAIKRINLKKIKFKRDPGNLESFHAYEGYLLEEDDATGIATVFIPGLQDALMSVDSDTIEEFVPPVESNLCKLKACAAKCLIESGLVDCELELQKINTIQTLEQLEFYLNQFELSDLDLLNIYRSSFHEQI